MHEGQNMKKKDKRSYWSSRGPYPSLGRVAERTTIYSIEQSTGIGTAGHEIESSHFTTALNSAFTKEYQGMIARDIRPWLG
jgi:hypothetical protein